MTTFSFTKAQIKFIEDNYTRLPITEIAETLNLTEIQIYRFAYSRGIKKQPTWSQEEIDFLCKNHNKMSRTELSEAIGRSKKSIYNKLSNLNLTSRNAWSPQEIEWLLDNYPSKGVDYCANKLNRSRIAIRKKVWKLNCTTSYRRPRETEQYGSNHGNWRGCHELSSAYFSRLKKGARIRKILFNITMQEAWNQFIKQKKKCALSGIKLIFSNNSRLVDQTASLDRIDSSQGYTKDNIQWIHKDLNKMKQEYSQPEFIEWCHRVSKYHD